MVVLYVWNWNDKKQELKIKSKFIEKKPYTFTEIINHDKKIFLIN